MAKPTIPKGTRDFSSDEMRRREYIFNTIKDVFKLAGYQPIETPAMENLSSLLGKYGDEGDKLLFKVLNSGDCFSSVSDEELLNRDASKTSLKLCEKGLRYDLTVPFARFVVQHRDEIVFPFKRYQIQPVWRADRPQKGRYREFVQCDVDVIGSDSLLNEYELINIIDEVFVRLNINVIIKINNRKILAGIANFIGESDKMVDITVAIDKLEKIGMAAVNEELRSKGLSEESISKLRPVLELEGDTDAKLTKLEQILSGSEEGIKGVEETRTIFELLKKTGLRNSVELDLTLARGLNYYTGAILEVKAADAQMGSICGGGRYDNLTGVFGLDGVSGVGVSFGADRIYDVMTQLNLFEKMGCSSTEVLVLNFGEKESLYGLQIVKELRQNDIKTELYPDVVKLKKQMSYANAKGIPYVIMAGEEEINNNQVTIKNMIDGQQYKVNVADVSKWIENNKN